MIEVGACRLHELPDVVALATRAFRPPGSPASAMADAYPLLFAEDNLEHLRVVRANGAVVACAGLVLRELCSDDAGVRVGLVGAVCTEPGHGGHGHASRALEDLWSVARSAGAVLLLVSGRRGLYARLGCEPLAPALCVRVPAAASDEVDLRRIPPTAPGAEDLSALQSLHDRERVRLLRSAATWVRLLAAQTAFWRPGGVALVTPRNGAPPVAYLAAEDAPAMRAGLPTLRVVETAGARRDVLVGAAALAQGAGAAQAEIVAPQHDVALCAAVRELGLPCGTLDLPFSVAYLDDASRGLDLPGYGLDYI